MRLSLTSLLRTMVWAALGMSGIAIAVGRHAPRMPPCSQKAAPRYYQKAAPRYYGVNGHLFSAGERQPHFFDRATGRPLPVQFPAEDRLEYPACSPWRDERGQYQVVSRWMRYEGGRVGALPMAFGLARYTLPEGRLVGRVALDVLATGEPCWAPEPSPQVFFTGGDGSIYRYTFAEAEGGHSGDAQARAQIVPWRMTQPGLGSVFIKDLVWPTDPTLEGRLVASLTYMDRRDGETRYIGHQLWWLQLSDDRTVIEKAGRITIDDSDGLAPVVQDPDREERLPNVATGPEGGLVLAYLARSHDRSPWELCLARIEIDPGTGGPRGRRGGKLGQATDCVLTTPFFSTDGRWLYGLFRSGSGLAWSTPRRFAVADTLATAGAGGADCRPQPPRAGPASLPGLAVLTGSAPNRLVDRRPGRHAGR